MSIREQLLEIRALKIGDRLLHMEEDHLKAYLHELNHFIDIFPQIQSKVLEALGKKDTMALTEKVVALKDDLLRIGADDIAAECQKYVSAVSSDSIGKFESYVGFLLSQLAALSIDIQMAIFKEGTAYLEAEPAKKAPPEPPKPAPAPAAPMAPIITKTVLAVDDDPQCLDLFKMALKDVPCKIIAVTSGPTALGILKKQEPDLFVFDIDMPVMNGLDLAKKVKEAGHNQPLIFITGNSQKETVAGALMAGGNDFILKPINPENVRERVTKFLGL